MERNILLTIGYDGTGFCGWQRQPGAFTIQGEVERVLSQLCKRTVKIHGTSRTDGGVHALGQKASFKGEFGIPTDRIPLAANNLLAAAEGKANPCGSIRIIDAEEMDLDFHARFDAKGKTYQYVIRHGLEPDIFRRNYCYQLKDPLDVKAMEDAAGFIEGTHDFACFQAAGGNLRETTVRTIYALQIKQPERGKLLIEVTGDGFLYHMVRIIVGTLVEIGQGRKRREEIPLILASADRRKAGHTAPPQGLYLKQIYYDERLMKERH